MKTFFACFVGVVLGAAASEIRVLDPLQDSDCVLCKHLIDNWGEGNIYNWGESNDLIRKAACAVLLEDSDARIVDPKWKLHSAAMLANDKESTILKEAIKLRNMLGIDPTLICGFMGVQSSKGGCACPIELIQFKGLKDAIASVRDSTSGSLLSSKPSEVKIALKCDTTTNQISLLELGKRRANIRTRARTSISIQNSDACTGDRGKGYHNKEVKGLMNSVQSHSGLVKKVGDTGTGLALGGASVGLTILCPPIGIAFGVLAGALSFFGGEASEDLEREIMRKIMRQTHHAITKKVQPAGGGTPKCVWELAKESPKYDRYVQAVKDLGLEFNKMYHEGKTEDGAPLPQVLKSTPAVTMTNLLLNLVPGTATMLTQEAFKYTLDGVLSDVYSNRAICVMYVL